MMNEDEGCEVVVVDDDFEGGDFLPSPSMSAPASSLTSGFVISSLIKSLDLLRVGGACVVVVVAFLLEDDFLSGGFFGKVFTSC